MLTAHSSMPSDALPAVLQMLILDGYRSDAINSQSASRVSSEWAVTGKDDLRDWSIGAGASVEFGLPIGTKRQTFGHGVDWSRPKRALHIAPLRNTAAPSRTACRLAAAGKLQEIVIKKFRDDLYAVFKKTAAFHSIDARIWPKLASQAAA